MFGRLLLGLLLGLVVGGALAAGLVAGLGVSTFSVAGGAVLAYAAAAVTGALTGLVAGKPIWASGAKIEAGLKAFFGAAIAAGVMFALRQWAPSSWTLDLPAIGAHGSPLWDLPAVSLPLVAAVLGGFFELDNTGDGNSEESAPRSAAVARKGGSQRVVEARRAGARVADGVGGTRTRLAEGEDREDEVEVPRGAKR
ncbi:MAG: hypothetical protein JOZ69_18930 [Myxococcales bacterium]|nr:hypothetical protein [Myxococcales bacterium]